MVFGQLEGQWTKAVTVVEVLIRKFRLAVVDIAPARDIEALRAPWLEKGVELVGPLAPAEIMRSPTQWADGAVISLNVDTISTVGVIDVLEREQVPFLFTVRDRRLATGFSCYVFDGNEPEIDRILEGLARQNRGSLLH